MDIKFTLDKGAYAPEKAHEDDAGYDLRIPRGTGTWIFKDDGSLTIDTGVHVAIPKGYVGIVTSKSGLNVKRGIICPPGVIDSGYTGSIVVKLYNLGEKRYIQLTQDNKVAQLLIVPIADCNLVQVDRLEETERGNSGFGSTGR